jgi:hypothetical protein
MAPPALRDPGVIAALAVAHYTISFGLLVLSFGGAMGGLDTGAAPTPLQWLATLLYPVFTFPAHALLRMHPVPGFDLLLLGFTSVLWGPGIFVLVRLVRTGMWARVGKPQ